MAVELVVVVVGWLVESYFIFSLFFFSGHSFILVNFYFFFLSGCCYYNTANFCIYSGSISSIFGHFYHFNLVQSVFFAVVFRLIFIFNTKVDSFIYKNTILTWAAAYNCIQSKKMEVICKKKEKNK